MGSFTRNCKNKPLKRIIKYLLNVTCLGFLIAKIGASYGIIVRVPNLERIFDMIWKQAGNVAWISILFVLISTYLNFFFERKIERRKTSQEFIIISLIHIVMITLAFAYFSLNFYLDYIEHPEYF